MTQSRDHDPLASFSRRQALAIGAAVSLGACTPALTSGLARSVSPLAPLKELARLSGRRFGSAVAWGQPGADRGSFAYPSYAAVLQRECELLVPENELKWQAIRPNASSFDFRHFDDIARYSQLGGFQMRGHTLLWLPDKWYPRWLLSHDFGSRPAVSAAAMLTNHVQTVVGRYGPKIYSYDVVNEAIQPETGAIRDTVLTRAMGGEALLDHMFHAAKAGAPHAELVYNDYMSWERGTEDETHMAGVLRLLEGFRKRGTPVDALGIQSHIRLLKDLPVAAVVRESEGPWRRFLDQVVGMGYKLVITEFDVNDKKAPDNIVLRDRIVADYARAYLDVMFDYPQLRDVLAWGMVDKYSWLTDFDPRPDKSVKRGTPYDSSYQPKPLRQAIADAYIAAPPLAPTESADRS